MAEAGRGFRDTLVALALVGLILGGLWLYTGVWPPMVVVESGSMMHPEEDVPFGRIGTIDPGDLVLVKGADGRDGIRTWADAEKERYGAPGDVLVYYPSNDARRTPVIHRAVTWVDVEGDGAFRTYTFAWPEATSEPECRDGVCRFDARGVYFPPLGFDDTDGFPFKRNDGWKPESSGWITKGDNPRTNERADQATGISCPEPGREPSPKLRCAAVDPAWLQGVARGELPWFGLIKLAVAGRPNMEPQDDSWITILWATAPRDLWIMLALTLVLLVTVPIAIDHWRAGRDA